MEKLADIKVGEKLAMDLIVLEANERKTRASKSYVAVKLSDGVTQIAGNYWDWPEGSEVPRRGAVYKVGATVSDWQGVPQLNIVRMEESSADPADFIPATDIDINAVYSEAIAMIEQIKDSFLKDLAHAVFESLKGKWLVIPGARTVHHAYKGGTLIHSVNVAKIAAAIADNIKGANKDLVVIGALVHDLGKLYTYGFDGAAIDFTDEGQLYEHAFIGAEFIGNFAESLYDGELAIEDERKLSIIRHIQLSHHLTLEHGAVVTPRCIEAYIVHYADAVDATAEQIRVADNSAGTHAWTDKIWTLGNAMHLKPTYINKMFEESIG